ASWASVFSDARTVTRATTTTLAHFHLVVMVSPGPTKYIKLERPYFLSIRCRVNVRMPQYMCARAWTGMRAASSEYQIQILPLSLSKPEAASGCTRMVLKVPAGVLI